MAWRIEMKPVRSGKPRLPTGEIRNVDNNPPPGRKPFRGFAQQGHRVGNVLEYVENDDEIKPGIERQRLNRLRGDVQAERAPGFLCNLFVTFNTQRFPCTPRKSRKHQAW